MPGLSKDGKFYVINADFRHYYHQLPVHASLQPFFTMMVAGSAGRPEEWYVPRALPMGWILAPYIAQSCTWAMLLGKHGKLSVGEHGFDKAMAEALPSLPALIPLAGGGGIVVLMDNILVVTPDESVGKAWKQRLLDMTCDPRTSGKGFNVQFKDTVELQTIWKETSGASAASSASSSPANHFDFLGIRWYYDERKLVVDDELPDGLDVEAGTWTGNHRELASVVGKLLWFHRVADRDMFEFKMSGFRTLLSRVTPAEGRWEDPVAPPPADCVRAIVEGWALRKQQLRYPNVPSVPFINPRIAYAAVDASDSAYGAVYWDTDIDGAWTEWGSMLDRNHPADFSYIALSELSAIIIAVHQLRERVPGANCLVIATDNLTAKTWIENRVAKSPVANQLLEYLFYIILGPLHLHLVYVRSAENAADPASRNARARDERESSRISDTVALLRAYGSSLRVSMATRRERESDE